MVYRISAYVLGATTLVVSALLVLSPASPLAGAPALLPGGGNPAVESQFESAAGDDRATEPDAGDDRATEPDAPMGLQGDLVAAFYYQGFLTEDGAPVTGAREMEFQLWSNDKIPEQVGVTLDRTVTVENGQFNTSLGWGSNEFNGRGVKIQVRVQDSTGTWHALPRGNILPVPYAMSLKPGAVIVSEQSLTAVTFRNTAGDGISSTGSDTGVVGMTTSGDRNEAAVKGTVANTRSEARGGAFSSVSGVGLYGGSLGNNGVEGKGCSLPGCYGGYFDGDSGIYAESDDDTAISYAGHFVGDVKVTEGLAVDGPVILRGDIWGLTVRDRARFNSATVTGTLQAGGLVVNGPAGGFFPRTSWDSRWEPIGRNGTETLTHDLGGDPSDYFVDFQCRDTASGGLGIHVLGHGGISVTNPPRAMDSRGAYYRNLTGTTVRIFRLPDDDYCDEVRVRLWKIN